jgi:transcriptional regulator with XRE-family HTH domain
MKLADYLTQKGISQKDFALAAGISTGTVSLLVRGMVGVSDETLQKITVATKGKVSKRDFKATVWVAAE